MRAFTAVLILTCLLAPLAAAAADKDDWLRGRLFPPDIVLQHQAQLELTAEQRKVIRAEVTGMQSKIAAVDWDIMEAGLAVQEEISALPVNREAVLDKAGRVFEAENRKKRAWLEMLINIKNALTPRQVEYLQRVTSVETAR